MYVTDILQEILDLTREVSRGETSRPVALDVLKRRDWFAHPDAAVRERAIRMCHSLRFTEVQKKVRRLFTDPDPLVRQMAVAYHDLFEPLSAEMVDAIAELANDESEDVRRKVRALLFDKLDGEQAARRGLSWVKHPISAWKTAVSLPSPNKRYVAHFEGWEIAMGAPSIGHIYLDGLTIGRTNASMIWSGDSRYLAFPRWRKDRSQFVAVVDMHTRREGEWPVRAGVYHTVSFARDTLVVEVNPVTSNTKKSLDLSDVHWS